MQKKFFDDFEEWFYSNPDKTTNNVLKNALYLGYKIRILDMNDSQKENKLYDIKTFEISYKKLIEKYPKYVDFSSAFQKMQKFVFFRYEYQKDSKNVYHETPGYNENL